jgi:hypothetical protein
VQLGGDFAAYDLTNGFQAFAGYSAATTLDAMAVTDTGNLSGVSSFAIGRTVNGLKLNDLLPQHTLVGMNDR